MQLTSSSNVYTEEVAIVEREIMQFDLFIFHIHSATSIPRKLTSSLRYIWFEIRICLHNYPHFM